MNHLVNRIRHMLRGEVLSPQMAGEIRAIVDVCIKPDPYAVVIKHTDPTQIKTALALAERKLKRAEEALKESEWVINKFSGWYYNDGDECPMTQHEFCPNIDERKEEHSKRMADELEADRWEFDPAVDCCECDYIHIAAGCFAEYYRKQYRDKQAETSNKEMTK